VIRVPLCARVSRVCPGSLCCLFTGTTEMMTFAICTSKCKTRHTQCWRHAQYIMSTAADAAADESFSRIAWRRAAESLQLLQTACAAAAEAAQSAREDVIDGCVSCMKRRGVSSEAVIDLESLIDGSTQRSCAPGETSTSSPSELLVHRWMSYTLAPALSIALLVTSGWTGLIVLVVVGRSSEGRGSNRSSILFAVLETLRLRRGGISQRVSCWRRTGTHSC
jgi:hypothetical protein